MKKLFFIALAVCFIGISCTKDITRFNEQTKNAANVPGEMVFSTATLRYVRMLASPNVNTNIFRFTVGYWATTTYQDEPQYDFETRNISGGEWTTMYRDVLSNLQEATRLIEADADPSISAGSKANKLAQVDIMAVNAWYFLVTSFGNVPYSEALKLNDDTFFPKYDDAKTIYDDLLTRLTADVAALNAAEKGISAGQDIIFGGNVASWKKFGSSILLRMAMTIVDADASKAKSVFEAADANAFGPGEIAKYDFLSDFPNTNPIWEDLVKSGRQDYVGAKPLLDQLVSMSDPRLTAYYKPNGDGKWIGGTIGENNTFSTTAKPSDLFLEETMPFVLMDYSEVEFLRAEAVERGFSITGTAAEHYNNAVTASIKFWGGTGAEAATYLARPDVAYTTAAGAWKQKIGFQKWIALYGEPAQEWLEMRRLDFPNTTVVPAPVGAKSGYPNRLPYPQSEQTLNPDGYASGSSDIGGDKVETKLWWDKN